MFPQTSRRSTLLLTTFLAAVILTVVSFNLQRVGPEVGIYGNVCGPSGNDVCYQELLKGGFPFAYIFDDLGVSVRGQLGILEDEFHLFPFTLDVMVFGSAIWLALSLVYKITGSQKPPV